MILLIKTSENFHVNLHLSEAGIVSTASSVENHVGQQTKDGKRDPACESSIIAGAKRRLFVCLLAVCFFEWSY